MSMRLRADLSWCVCDDRAVFLDLKRDRYFCLPPDCDALFRRWTSGEDDSEARLASLVARRVLESGHDGDEKRIVAPMLPARDLATEPYQAARRADIVAAFAWQMRATIQLRSARLETIIGRLSRTGPPLGKHDISSDQEGRATQIADAFAAVMSWLRSADQCLPRAIAARQLCNRSGVPSTMIFGVRLHPFSAHCWVQAADAVIVGEFEQARLYTPILVIS